MTVQRMDNVGIVVDDLATTIEFFRELGLELEGQATIEGEWAGRVTGLGDQRVEIAMMRTPDGHSRLELSRFLTPPVVADHRNAPVNAFGYLRVMSLSTTSTRRLPGSGSRVRSSSAATWSSTKTRTDSAISAGQKDFSSGSLKNWAEGRPSSTTLAVPPTAWRGSGEGAFESRAVGRLAVRRQHELHGLVEQRP
jgi:hypothetical protein